MAWFILVLAGLLEVLWAFALKQSRGFTRLGPSLAALAGMGASFALLSIAMRSLPLGTAYMIWTGIGALGAFGAGILFLGEPAGAGRICAGLLILGGLILMKASSAAG